MIIQRYRNKTKETKLHKPLNKVAYFPYRSTLRAAVVKSLLALGLAIISMNSIAETCQMVGGCIGNVWYMHIPKSQFQSAKLFTKAGLPNVNTVATLLHDSSLLSSSTFDEQHYLEELATAIELAKQNEKVLVEWGWILRSNSKLRILSYKTFPQLKNAGDELFALVLVLSD